MCCCSWPSAAVRDAGIGRASAGRLGSLPPTCPLYAPRCPRLSMEVTGHHLLGPWSSECRLPSRASRARSGHPRWPLASPLCRADLCPKPRTITASLGRSAPCAFLLFENGARPLHPLLSGSPAPRSRAPQASFAALPPSSHCTDRELSWRAEVWLSPCMSPCRAQRQTRDRDSENI